MLHHGRRVAPVRFVFVASGGAFNTSAMALPSTCAVGDLCFYFAYSGTAFSIPGIGVPTGYTLISNNTGANFRSVLWYKQLVSGDPGNNIPGLSGAPAFGYIIHNYLVVRPSRFVNSVSYGGVQNQVTHNTPSNQTVSASGVASPRLVFAVVGQESATGDPVWNPNPWENSVNGYSSSQKLAYLNQQLSADVVLGVNDTGNNNTLTSGWITAT